MEGHPHHRRIGRRFGSPVAACLVRGQADQRDAVDGSATRVGQGRPERPARPEGERT
jgi:hypothetical protein